jgi:hypothetical protein
MEQQDIQQVPTARASAGALSATGVRALIALHERLSRERALERAANTLRLIDQK